LREFGLKCGSLKILMPRLLAAAGPTKEAVPSASIVFNASASAALSVAENTTSVMRLSCGDRIDRTAN
jgi:hypothetical protein